MRHSCNVAVLASGRGSNFKAIAEACRNENFPAVVRLLIVDNPDAGALRLAEEMGIETAIVDCGPKRGSMTPESSEEMYRLATERDIELVCLAGFMRIVKGRLLDEYQGRMINIHPALLPSFKGLQGQKQALDYGVRYSGCSVHFVDPGVDTGPIILQRVVPVHQDDDEESLSARILKEEHKAYPEAVRLFAEGRLRIEGRRVRVLDET
ncbi:MAG: phosphoribosylglycinamide formyltransferase [bacterium]|nr:MAG: phosphoribosylglycinamide formyltransferase [bacterium]